MKCRTVVRAALAVLTGCAALSVAVVADAPGSQAQPGGPDQTPVMGWSSWSFLRLGVNASDVEKEAQAMVSSGLTSVGYRYLNIDDGWYTCSASQGPNVDQYGRWVIDTGVFPNVGSENGIEALAAYVHGLGLKFGIYETAGISQRAVSENTQVLGTSYTADQIALSSEQDNYNCGGSVRLNYRSPGAQAYVNSVVDELASWGVDYIKLDGITNANVADIKAWSQAIRQSGRPMVFDTTQGELTTSVGSKLKRYANQWEFAPDIEINGPGYSGSSSVFPLTSYSHWSDRFNDVAKWKRFGGPGGFNDYDSIEVGDGPGNSGMSLAAEESQLSLWALGSSPLILGGDLTSAVTDEVGSSSGLNATDLSLLTNTKVIAVDQDAIDASRIVNVGTEQVFAKKEFGGTGVVGMFNTNTDLSAASEIVATTTHAMRLPRDSRGYAVQDLWTGQSSTIPASGKIVASVPSEGVAFYRVTPL